MSDNRSYWMDDEPDTSDRRAAVRELDTIQRNIWARINDEINVRGIKISTGDAYALGSVIKEVLHPQARKLIDAECLAVLDRVNDEFQEHIDAEIKEKTPFTHALKQTRLGWVQAKRVIETVRAAIAGDTEVKKI